MSKKISFAIAIMIIFAIFIYKLPVEINKEFSGKTISSVSANSNKPAAISINGKLHRNLFSQDSFSGTVIIGSETMQVSTPIPANLNMRIKGLKAKLSGKPIEAVGIKVETGAVKTTGQVMFSRRLDMLWGYSNALREQYNDSSLDFEGSLLVNNLP